ncbi:hypothetical protein HHK36_025781 [Tetracentron sinense]|uniref:Uncharacterized protein n=1 Tax=Tetracentron sinense TaxID=13715 RepID=A0A834YL56_TETSI|nr:hypothetical protein HHK36_025781 [Tetracentron sinense]
MLDNIINFFPRLLFTFCLLQVLIRFVANLEFFDPSSSVHAVNGLHGYISLLDDCDVQAPNRCAPYRLNFLGYK